MTHLTTQARYQIAHDLRMGCSNKQIAQGTGYSVRTIEREVAANGGRACYSAPEAILARQQKAAVSARNHPTIADAVWDILLKHIQSKLSPDQAIRYENLSHSVSSVYRHLHRTRNLKIRRHLRRYKSQPGRASTSWVRHARSIHQRPREVLTRDGIGHAETDSIVGRRHESSKVIVLIDRATRYVRLGLVRDGTSKKVARHFAHWLTDERLPILTITTDQGVEFSGLPALFPDRLYACDAGKPYQKGAVENMNGLIRQYLAKGKSLRRVTQSQLNAIANELNNRPRKRLGYRSPAQLLSEITAARQFER